MERGLVTFMSSCDPDKGSLITVKTKPEFSPTIYLHWMGGDVVELLEKTNLRRGDECYSAARFTATACSENKGNLGVGLLPPPPKWAQRIMLRKGTQECDELSNWHHGDNGVFMVNVDTGEVFQFYYVVSGDECSQHQYRVKIATIEIGEDCY